jgi:hypothetical protein
MAKRVVHSFIAKGQAALAQWVGAGVGHLWLPLLLVSMVLLIMTTAVSGHGGSGYYLVRGEQVGKYIVHAWVSPGVMRTGDVHVDVALFDLEGKPALLPLIRVALTPLDGKSPPLVALAGPPQDFNPFARDARFWLERPGLYQLEIEVDDGASESAMDMEVNVQAVSWPVKLALFAGIIASAGCGAWLLLETKKFWRLAEREAEDDADEQST